MWCRISEPPTINSIFSMGSFNFCQGIWVITKIRTVFFTVFFCTEHLRGMTFFELENIGKSQNPTVFVQSFFFHMFTFLHCGLFGGSPLNFTLLSVAKWNFNFTCISQISEPIPFLRGAVVCDAMSRRLDRRFPWLLVVLPLSVCWLNRCRFRNGGNGWRCSNLLGEFVVVIQNGHNF